MARPSRAVNTTLAALQALAMIVGPLVLMARWRARSGAPWRLAGLGALTFVASQAVHIPLLLAVHPERWRPFGLAALGLGLAAGLCEELARWVLARRLGAQIEGRDAVMAGLGHGGIECMLLGVFALLVSFVAPVPPGMRALAVFERIMALTLHVAASSMVFASVRTRRRRWLVAAIALHTLVDAVVVYASVRWGAVAAEVWLLALMPLTVAGFVASARDTVLTPAASPWKRLPDEGDAIVCEGLTRRFGDALAVDEVTLAIRRGEVFALLGPNGAGKTTMVRMLCGLLAPTAGRVRVAGVDVPDGGDVFARVGLLTESPGLYERLTLRENLALFASLHALDEATARARIDALLARLSLADRADDRVGTFSKGMMQKVALARALLHEPAVVFLDEPTAGLDPESCAGVRAMIRELRDRGCTVFLTTHRLDEADELADRVGIYRTRLLAVDTVAGLRARVFGRQLAITLAPCTDAHAQLAASLPDVRAVTRDGDTLTLTADDPDALAPVAIDALVHAGARITKVAEVVHSLESVYFQLLGGAP